MVQAILTLYSWRSRAACDITAGKAAALVGRYARIQTRIQRCGFLALAAQAQHMDSSDRAHSIPRPAFGGAMLTLRWGRAAPPAPAVARRSVPPAAKSGLLGRLHFWSAGVAPSGVEHHAQRTRTTNLGVRSSNLFGRATSSFKITTILAVAYLPCRTKKFAWYLHGRQPSPVRDSLTLRGKCHGRTAPSVDDAHELLPRGQLGADAGSAVCRRRRAGVIFLIPHTAAYTPEH